MAKSKNNFPGLVNALSRGKKSSSLVGAPSVVTGSDVAGSTTLEPGKAGATRAASLGSKGISTGITFGRPSSTKIPATTGTDWGKLLEQAASGGIASSFGLGSVSGLQSLVSGIASLFGGGKKTLTPLQEFQLPAAQNQTITVGANGLSGMATTTQSIQDQSPQIAQAVKSTLLHSSSLNDIIAEI
jgi:hypothetical protein